MKNINNGDILSCETDLSKFTIALLAIHSQHLKTKPLGAWIK